jgi:hypothetical protein
MTYWAQLLHFYQPPTQSHDVLRRVADESYRPLLQVLREHADARVAVNMNGVLTEMLLEHGLADVVTGLRELAEAGRVEFVGSGKFHPILPLIPEGERQRSITENARTNRAAFGSAFSPRGFFPPEMCYSADILTSIAAGAHEWVVLSGVACPAEWPIDRVYRAPAGSGTINLLFRDDARSNRISFRETDPARFLDDLAHVGGGRPAYILTAMDAETYGHHIAGWERDFLGATLAAIAMQKPLAKGSGMTRTTMVLPSELLALFPAGETLEPFDSSWSTSRDDIAAQNPYPLWKSPGNRIHELQWQYVDHCLALLAIGQRYAESAEARQFADIASAGLQPALHSCQFWWASRRPMWDVPMVHRGFLLLSEVLIAAARSVEVGSASERVKREAGWRLASANEARIEFERELIGGRA